MAAPSLRAGRAIAWLLLSPLAFLMALISTVESETIYQVQLVAFGSWSVLGMASGLGALLQTSWAVKVQRALSVVAIGYFALAGVLIASYLLSAAVNGGVASSLQAWGIAGLVVFAAALYFRHSKTRNRGRREESDA
jgi:hypothetical protein